MMNSAIWKPSVKWHACFLGILLMLCLIGFLAFSYLSTKLPAPYQIHRPAAAATPWKADS